MKKTYIVGSCSVLHFSEMDCFWLLLNARTTTGYLAITGSPFEITSKEMRERGNTIVSQAIDASFYLPFVKSSLQKTYPDDDSYFRFLKSQKMHSFVRRSVGPEVSVYGPDDEKKCELILDDANQKLSVFQLFETT